MTLNTTATKGKTIHLCAYWNCAREIDINIAFCHEHNSKWNSKSIDQCPKCGRYKDIGHDLCPDCKWRRPVPSWKISSRTTDPSECIEKVNKETPYINRDLKNDGHEESEHINMPFTQFPMNPTGEAFCPLCQSSNISYKSVFDYFKCNDCKNTFMRPVHNYRDRKGEIKAEPKKYLPQEISEQSELKKKEEGSATINTNRKPIPGKIGLILLFAVLLTVFSVILLIWYMLDIQVY